MQSVCGCPSSSPCMIVSVRMRRGSNRGSRVGLWIPTKDATGNRTWTHSRAGSPPSEPINGIQGVTSPSASAKETSGDASAERLVSE